MEKVAPGGGREPAAAPVVDRRSGQGRGSSTSSRRVTDDKGPDFVPARERIAVFDNDGTLWVEHPIPFQLMFAIDRAKAMLAADARLAAKQTFKALLGGEAPRSTSRRSPR